MFRELHENRSILCKPIDPRSGYRTITIYRENAISQQITYPFAYFQEPRETRALSEGMGAVARKKPKKAAHQISGFSKKSKGGDPSWQPIISLVDHSKKTNTAIGSIP